MPKTRRMLTRLSKGELSPLLEGSPDLSGYYEGASILENFKVARLGVITRWEGTRFIKEVKDSTKDTILWPFEFSTDAAYMLEVGDLYIRIYKTKAPVLNGGVHVEVVTPFLVADIRTIHMTQSADVLFTFHSSYPQRKLSRVSDTSWVLSMLTFSPPPSFEADTNLGDTLALSANTGTDVRFRAGSAIFLDGDDGRQIISGAGRAVITSFVDTSEVVADILDAFTQPITAGLNTLTSVATAVTSVAHGAIVGQFAVLTSGAQSGQMRKITVITGPDTFTILTAFTVDQGAGVTWNLSTPLALNTWGLRLSPQTTLDPNKKGPRGSQVTLVAGVAAFRTADIGKYIKIYGGLVLLTKRDSGLQVKGTILSGLTDADPLIADPVAVGAGAWTLEVASWSVVNGFPGTGEFFQGRLTESATLAQPTTIWASRSDNYENFGVGVSASKAWEYTMASRKVNRIIWLAEKSKVLCLGTSGSEHIAAGSGNTDALIGGDVVPIFDRIDTNGCMPIQPAVVSKQTVLYIDRSRRKVMALGFDDASGEQAAIELTVGAEHITKSGVRLGPLAFERRLDPRLYFAREDGQGVSMTYFPEQKVVAFSRRTTLGAFGCFAVISNAGGGADQVWTIAARTINGVPKRFVEMFEPNHEGLAARPWTSLQTDCAVVLTGQTGEQLTGLGHLEAATVDVVKNGGFIGSYLVTGGAVTLTEELVAEDVCEVGLHYDSRAVTMRPSIPGTVIEGLPLSWDSLFVRVHQTIGGRVNGSMLDYPPDALDEQGLKTGDVKVTGQGWDDGKITIEQPQPYPMTVLCTFGTLSVGETD